MLSCDQLMRPHGCSLPGSSVHGIHQARILEWVAISFSRGIFLTQESSPGLLHCRQILYRLSCEGKPQFLGIEPKQKMANYKKEPREKMNGVCGRNILERRNSRKVDTIICMQIFFQVVGQFFNYA